MTINKNHHLQRPYILKFFLWPIIFYLFFLGVYTAYLLAEMRQTTLKEIDNRLSRAVQKVPSLLADDFHDRAVGPDSIGRPEELANRQRVNDFVKGGNFVYAYTLIKKDGMFYFTAPTVTAEEALERDSWYFYPYTDAPPAFSFALESGKTQFIDYEDSWGNFRSVVMPLTSPGGRRYLACIDVRQDVVERMMNKAQWVAGFTGMTFSLMILLFLFASFKAHKTVIHYSQAMAKENNKLRHQAEYDGLTGILNHKAFFRAAEAIYAKRSGSKTGGAIMMLDCDYFKEINDQFGHLAGDRALTFLAGIYRQVFTKKTLVGRYGGDEFIVFMPGVTQETAEIAARLVIDTVQHQQAKADGIVLPLSVSIGAVWFADHSHSFLELVKLADDALLEIKHSGQKPGFKLVKDHFP